jgi:PBP1b-binding outer membrane lipoprotein LpoB
MTKILLIILLSAAALTLVSCSAAALKNSYDKVQTPAESQGPCETTTRHVEIHKGVGTTELAAPRSEAIPPVQPLTPTQPFQKNTKKTYDIKKVDGKVIVTIHEDKE